tara:strand:+ start:439 stop:648 length:210 start_codon:yes stop_codon:yes gene_type:complete
MRVYLIDKFLIRHSSFLYLEIKHALFHKPPARGNFKLLKRLYVRFVVNYIESLSIIYLIIPKTKVKIYI